MPPVIDAHVHVFPQHIFAAVRKWFGNHAWHIRYQMDSPRVLEFLLAHGIEHVVALQYAHKPGIARELNNYLAEILAGFDGRATGMATVFPGEEDADVILEEAFDRGLGGVKLHAHVQCFDMNAGYMDCLYDCCRRNNKPMVMHVGREPKSSAYCCDPHQLCSAGKLEKILKNFPGLRICVPHLGFSEVEEYRELIEKYDTLWLDTTMAVADYFPVMKNIDLSRYRADRIMYGSDFPNIPFAWDRELKALKSKRFNLPGDHLEKITRGNAIDFFGLPQ